MKMGRRMLAMALSSLMFFLCLGEGQGVCAAEARGAAADFGPAVEAEVSAETDDDSAGTGMTDAEMGLGSIETGVAEERILELTAAAEPERIADGIGGFHGLAGNRLFEALKALTDEASHSEEAPEAEEAPDSAASKAPEAEGEAHPDAIEAADTVETTDPVETKAPKADQEADTDIAETSEKPGETAPNPSEAPQTLTETSLGTAGEPEPCAATDESEPQGTTVMVYMVGSVFESLRLRGTRDILKIMEGLGTAEKGAEKINLIVETGGCDKSNIESESYWGLVDKEKARLASVSGNDAAGQYADAIDKISWYQNQRWLVTGSGITPAFNDSEGIRENNMGVMDGASYSAELLDFIRTTRSSYPAKQYVFVLWDLGGFANVGLVYDQRGVSPLNTSGLINTLDQAGEGLSDGEKLFDLVYFQAGMTATVEYTLALEPYTTWFLAPEEDCMLPDWDLSDFLQGLCAEKELKSLIGDEMKRIMDLYETDREPRIITAVDYTEANKFNAFRKSLEQLGRELERYIVNDPVNAYRYIKASREVALSFNDRQAGIVDIGHFCDLLRRKDTGGVPKDIITCAGNVYCALTSLTDVRFTDDYREGYDGNGAQAAYGLSIYFPYYLADHFETDKNEEIRGKQNAWKNHLTAYAPVDGMQRIGDGFLRAVTALMAVKDTAVCYSGAYAYPALQTIHDTLSGRLAKLKDYYTIYDTDYLTPELAKALNSKLQYSMDAGYMHLEDTQTMIRDDRYIYSIGGAPYENAEYIYMHNWFTTEGGGSLGLGMLPVSADNTFKKNEETNRMELGLDHLQNDRWFSISFTVGSGDKAVTYRTPLAIFDNSFANNDPFRDAGSVYIPAQLYYGASGWNVLLVGDFAQDKQNGSITGLYLYDFDTAMVGQYYDIKEILEISSDFIIRPLYNASEYMFGLTYSRPDYIFQREIGYPLSEIADRLNRGTLTEYYLVFLLEKDNSAGLYRVGITAENNAYLEDTFGTRYLLNLPDRLALQAFTAPAGKESLYSILSANTSLNVAGDETLLKDPGILEFNVLPKEKYEGLSDEHKKSFATRAQEQFFPDKNAVWDTPGEYVAVAFLIEGDRAGMDLYNTVFEHYSAPCSFVITAPQQGSVSSSDVLAPDSWARPDSTDPEGTEELQIVTEESELNEQEDKRGADGLFTDIVTIGAEKTIGTSVGETPVINGGRKGDIAKGSFKATQVGTSLNLYDYSAGARVLITGTTSAPDTVTLAGDYYVIDASETRMGNGCISVVVRVNRDKVRTMKDAEAAKKANKLTFTLNRIDAGTGQVTGSAETSLSLKVNAKLPVYALTEKKFDIVDESCLTFTTAEKKGAFIDETLSWMLVTDKGSADAYEGKGLKLRPDTWNGMLNLELDEPQSFKGYIRVYSRNWVSDAGVWLPCQISEKKTAKPKLLLEKGTLIINSAAAAPVRTGVRITGGALASKPEIVDEDKYKDIFTFNTSSGSIVIEPGTAMPATGTYRIGVRCGKITGTLKVSVVNKAARLKAQVKGKIDLIAPNTAVYVTPKLVNSSQQVSWSLEAEGFKIAESVFGDTGRLVIVKSKNTASYKKGKVSGILRAVDLKGKTLAETAITIPVTAGKFTASAAPADPDQLMAEGMSTESALEGLYTYKVYDPAGRFAQDVITFAGSGMKITAVTGSSSIDAREADGQAGVVTLTRKAGNDKGKKETVRIICRSALDGKPLPGINEAKVDIIIGKK